MFVPLWGILLGFAALALLAMAIALWIKSIRASARLFRAVAEGSSDGLVLMERNSRIIWTNRAYSQIMGYAHGDLIGKFPLEFALPPRLALPKDEILAFRFEESDERFGKLMQMENVRADGSEFIHEFSHAAIHVGGKARFLLCGRDITERVAREKALVTAQERLKAQSLTDTLTGLSNRLHVQTCISDLLHQRRHFAVLQVDVDRMKKINDSLGHQAGDAVLRQVARGFRTTAQPDWICARIGGDEFVVLIPGIEKLDDALAVGDELLREISRPFKWNAGSLTAEVNIGAAVWDRTVRDMDELLHRADIALYFAKSLQTTSLAGFDEVLAREYEEAQALEMEVADALKQRRLSFVFQPIINLETNRVEKFEMLVRWRRGARGMVPPGVFIPIIKRLRLSELLDRFVIDCAEYALRRLDEGGLQHVGLSVNLSADAFESPALTDLLTWLAEDERIDPSRLCLEVLESTALNPDDPGMPVRSIERLRRAGYKVLLDDFGMGYAGLAHLSLLPISGLKVDRGLTSAVDTDNASRAIVVSLVRLAKKLGLELVVEGVENMAQIEIVRQAGCATFQGYAVSRPMKLKRAIQWAALDHATVRTGTDG